jgi:hypothetical protein
VTITETLEKVEKSTLKERIKVPFLVGLAVSCIVLSVVMDLPPLQKSITADSTWKKVPGITRRSGLSHMIMGKDPSWRPIVVYNYKVDNVEYANDVIAFPEWAGLPGYEAGQVRLRYIPGTAVTVSYNPENPQDSCLETTPRWDVFFVHLICYFMFAALVFLSCYPPVKPDESV